MADDAERTEFLRLGYIAKSVGWSLLLLGLNMFVYHQFH
jgi:hypothetical protein